MAAPAEMPHADEALKSLVARFKEEPGSSAFTELAAALLARGHASEALRIAEHGLQMVPDNVEGRIQRAAALLALGRPRVAFVELKRALAINPTNRLAMRLLGKVYVDAGSPARAAELLKMRMSLGAEEEQETTHVTHAPIKFNGNEEHHAGGTIPRTDTVPLPKKGSPPIQPLDRDARARAAGSAEHSSLQETLPQHPPRAPIVPEPPPPPPPPAPRPAIPDLFSDLTRDLGLGDAVPEQPQSRVEVTQIIRRKKDRQPRSPSELAMIEGPIVDTTQPGQITESADVIGESVQTPLSSEPPPLFDAVTSPRLQIAGFGLDDEPLFQEHMPFAVRPVDGGTGDATPSDTGDPLSDLRETLDEEAPPELDTALRSMLNPDHRPPNVPDAGRFTEAGDTLVEGLEEVTGMPEAIAAPTPQSLAPKEEEAPIGEAAKFEGAQRPLLELSRPARRLAGAPKLEIVEPKAKPRDVMLAAIGAFFMLAALTAFLFLAPRPWRPAVFGGAQGHEAESAAGSQNKSPIAKEATR